MNQIGDEITEMRRTPLRERLDRRCYFWGAIGSAVVGAGVSLYGANQQAHDNRAANATNRAAVDKANNQEWNNYLLQRGVNAGGTAPYGVIPTNAAPVNVKLPLWANMNMPVGPGTGAAPSNVPLFVKRGP